MNGEALKAVTAQRENEYKKREAKSMASLAKCEKCQRRGKDITMRYKLNPRNLHTTTARLCRDCGEKGRWTPLYGNR